MQKLALEIEDQSQVIFDCLYKTKKCDIQGDIDKYLENMRNVKKFSCEITMKMNSWYEFVSNVNMLGKLTFPAKYYLGKKKLQRFIKNINSEIYSISVENRMIKERLTNWEHDLEILTIKQIRQENDYKSYTALEIKKNEMVSAVKYLLPTIPEACPAELILTANNL
jgi:hypothetical protein